MFRCYADNAPLSPRGAIWTRFRMTRIARTQYVQYADRGDGECVFSPFSNGCRSFCGVTVSGMLGEGRGCITYLEGLYRLSSFCPISPSTWCRAFPLKVFLAYYLYICMACVPLLEQSEVVCITYVLFSHYFYISCTATVGAPGLARNRIYLAAGHPLCTDTVGPLRFRACKCRR